MEQDRRYSISPEDRTAIDEAVNRNYYVSHDENGRVYIELAADHSDTNEFLLQAAYDHRDDAIQEPRDYEPENALLYALQDTIDESYEEYIWETEDQILRIAGFDPSDDQAEPQKEYLRETYPICPPYDHYLNQSMRVNIMLQTPEELNQDFGLIRNQGLAMARPDELSDSSSEAIQELLDTDSSLKRLVEQQGCTMEQLAETMRDYMHDFYGSEGHPTQHLDENGKSLPYETRMDLFSANRSRFLTTLCEELDNHTYSMGCITILAEVSMKEFTEMMKPGKVITMPTDSTVGIFNPWNGSGSILGVELAKPMVFGREDIYDVQVEGADLGTTCSLDRAFGLVRSAWHKPASISDGVQSLDKIIDSAAQRNCYHKTAELGRDDPDIHLTNR